MSAVLIALGGLALFFRAVNLLIYALNKRHLAALAQAPAPAEFPFPRISLLIPARNEARAIARTLRAALTQEYADFEIILVDDQSDDGTGEIARAIAADVAIDPSGRLQVIVGAPPPEGWLGKPWALMQAARTARGEVFIFMDADSRLAPGALRWTAARMAALHADALGLLPDFERESFWDEVLQPMLTMITLFELPVFWLNSDRQQRRWMGAGAFLAVTRPAYETIGGHAAVKDRIVEDIALATALKRSGAICRILDGRAFVKIRMYHGLREFVNGFRKNFALIFASPILMLFTSGFYLFLNLVQPLWAACIGAQLMRSRLIATAGEWLMLTAAATLIVQRLILAVELRQNPLYALTHPLQAAINGGVYALSAYDRFIKRSIRWRGRDIPMAAVRALSEE